MTAQPVHQYTARPVGDGSGLWELLAADTGQVLFRASKRLVMAKLRLNIDNDAAESRRGRDPRRKRER